MAVPEGVTPVYNNIIVVPYFGSGFGIRPVTSGAMVGSVYKIGSNCYRIAVNDKVGFLTTLAQFATDLGESFVVMLEEDAVITYVEIPPP